MRLFAVGNVLYLIVIIHMFTIENRAYVNYNYMNYMILYIHGRVCNLDVSVKVVSVLVLTTHTCKSNLPPN